MRSRLDGLPIVVIGGGPVGLPPAAHLIDKRATPLVLEAGPRVGSNVLAWVHALDSTDGRSGGAKMESSVHTVRNATGKVSMTTLLVVTLALAMIAATPEMFGPVATHARTDQLAFVAVHDRIPQIFLINTDGTGRRRLTGPPGRSTTPVWSPDGRQIAFVRQLGDDSQIYVMDADGRSQRPLTSTPGTRTSPAWSPDGRQIVSQPVMGSRRSS